MTTAQEIINMIESGQPVIMKPEPTYGDIMNKITNTKPKKINMSNIFVRSPLTGKPVNVQKLKSNHPGVYEYIDGRLRPTQGNELTHAFFNGDTIKIDSKWFISLGHTHQLDGENIRPRVNKQVINPITKRKININNSAVFKKLIKLDYVYNRDDNTLYPTKVVDIYNIEIKKKDGKYNFDEVLNIVKENLNKYYTLRLISEEYYDIGNDDTAKSIDAVRYIIFTSGGYYDTIKVVESDEGGLELKWYVKLSITSYNPLQKNRIGPALYNNCFYECLTTYFKDNINMLKRINNIDWTEYAEGVFEDDFYILAKSLQLNIYLYLPNDIEYKKIMCSTHSGIKTIKLIYNNNHVELYKHDKIIIEDYDLNAQFKNDMINNKVLLYKNHYENINGEKTEIIDYYETYTTKYQKLYSSPYILDEFKKHNNMIEPINNNHANINAIKSILQHGIHFNNANVNATNCYDLTKAYLNFQTYDCHNAIPCNLDININCITYDDNKINDIINNREGFVHATMEDIYTGQIIQRWVSMQYARHYLKNRPEHLFKAIEMMLASKTVKYIDLEFSKKDKRYQHMYGLMCKKTRKCYITTIDPVLASSYNGHITEYKKSKLYETKPIYIIKQEVDYTSNKYYFPHITGYAQNAAEIEIEKLILNNQLCISDIRSIFVDCVYTNKILKYDKVKFNNEKTCGNCNDTYLNNYVKTNDLLKKSDYYNDILFNNRVLLKGGPGTGKSYMLKQIYNSYSNPLLLLPNYELFKNYNEYNNIDVIQNFNVLMKKTDNNIINKYNIVLIDEYGLISREMISAYTPKQINMIVAGDLAQLKIINGTQINETNYDCKTITLTKNYRQTCPEFKKKLDECRLTGEYIFKQKTTLNYALLNKYIVLASTHAEIDKINDYAINKLKIYDNVPIRCYKTNNEFCASSIDYIINYKSNDDYYLLKSGLKIDKNKFNITHKLGFALTYHTYQGKTVETDNICISKNNMFDKNMLYMAVTRVCNEEQLYIIV